MGETKRAEAPGPVGVHIETSHGLDKIMADHVRECQRWGKPVPAVIQLLQQSGHIPVQPTLPVPAPALATRGKLCINCGDIWRRQRWWQRFSWRWFRPRCLKCGTMAKPMVLK
jgi:hypothetical protein